MRLLFVHERIGALAGAEANALATAAELKRRGHELGLIHGAGTGRDEATWRAVFAPRFEFAGRGGAEAVRSALATFAPDAVMVHKLADLDALEALAHGEAPVVRMVHDHELCCMRGYKYRYLSRRICNRAASAYCVFPCGGFLGRRAGSPGGFPFRWVSYRAKRRELALNRSFERMVVASDYMRSELMQNRFAADRIEMHAPVPELENTGFRSSFGPCNRIVFAGQLIRGKGVDVLLKSLALLQSDFECWILGDGNHRASCETLSRRLGLDDRVHFAGFVPRTRIREFYREATVAVVSSVWPEPFGAVGLEAMRCGLPVVAFDAGGIRDWLVDGENGFLVPWMDHARFAVRLDELLHDKELAQTLGERGRALARERFDFAEYVSRLENLFVQVTREHARAQEVSRVLHPTQSHAHASAA